MSVSDRLTRAGLELRKLALAYPEAYEELPWGHHAIKVNGKAFVFLAATGGSLSLSAKLPSSAGVALALPFAWIEESYRALAPKRLVRELDGTPAVKGGKVPRARTRAAPKRKGASR